MVLQVVDSEHSIRLLNIVSVFVDSSSLLLVTFSHLQNILQSIQSDLNDLVVGTLQQIAKRLDASLGNEVSNLTRFLQSSTGGIGHSPTSFLLGLEVGVLEDVDEGRDNVGIDDGLNLLRTSSSDIRDSPTCLLSDSFLGRPEEGKKCRESSRSQNDLGLQVISGDNVTDRTKSRSLNSGGMVPMDVGGKV